MSKYLVRILHSDTPWTNQCPTCPNTPKMEFIIFLPDLVLYTVSSSQRWNLTNFMVKITWWVVSHPEWHYRYPCHWNHLPETHLLVSLPSHPIMMFNAQRLLSSKGSSYLECLFSTSPKDLASTFPLIINQDSSLAEILIDVSVWDRCHLWSATGI